MAHMACYKCNNNANDVDDYDNICTLSVHIFTAREREGERERQRCRKLTLCICKMLTHYSKIIAQLFAINVIVIIVITVGLVVVLLFVDVAPPL